MQSLLEAKTKKDIQDYFFTESSNLSIKWGDAGALINTDRVYNIDTLEFNINNTLFDEKKLNILEDSRVDVEMKQESLKIKFPMELALNLKKNKKYKKLVSIYKKIILQELNNPDNYVQE